jgi:hypothetical protein
MILGVIELAVEFQETRLERLNRSPEGISLRSASAPRKAVGCSSGRCCAWDYFLGLER